MSDAKSTGLVVLSTPQVNTRSFNNSCQLTKLIKEEVIGEQSTRVNERSWSMENASAENKVEPLEKRMSEFVGSTWDKGGSSSKLVIDTDASTAASVTELYNKQELEKIKSAVSFKPLSVRNSDDTYKIVEELFPAANPSTRKQRVFLACWNDEGKQKDRYVIVKWRSKSRGFKDSWDHKEWIRAMKMLYYYSHHHDSETDVIDKRMSSSKNMDAKNQFSDHTAKILGLYEDAQGYHVLMEAVQGRDLFTILQEEKAHLGPGKNQLGPAASHKLPWEFVAPLMKGVLLGLKELHGKGLFHRDIKLENVVCLETGYGGKRILVPKLIDYDTVKYFNKTKDQKTIHVQGTDQYIAPETYNGRTCYSSDLYAVGVMGYILMTGCFPFNPETFDDVHGENYFGHPKMSAIFKKLLAYQVKYSEVYWQFECCPEGEEFCRRMLEVDVRKRWTVDEALSSAFIQKWGGTGCVCL